MGGRKWNANKEDLRNDTLAAAFRFCAVPNAFLPSHILFPAYLFVWKVSFQLNLPFSLRCQPNGLTITGIRHSYIHWPSPPFPPSIHLFCICHKFLAYLSAILNQTIVHCIRGRLAPSLRPTPAQPIPIPFQFQLNSFLASFSQFIQSVLFCL